MKTIKARVNSALILLFLASLSLSYLAYDHYKRAENLQSQVVQSLEIQDAAKHLDFDKRDRKALELLKGFRSELQESDRRNAVSNMIQAVTANNRRLYQTRVEEFEKVEQAFFRITNWKSQKIKRTGHFFALLAVFTPLLGLAWFIYYFNFGLLSPLQILSKRMMEFLTDQYTFRFSNPANNEIGNLERTFNALAQKVLNNIDELKALDRAKSEFVSIASHELRTPLTSIKGSLGLLSSQVVGKLDQEALDMVQIAEQETDRLVRLINDMLDLAKIESRSLQMEPQWSSLDEVLQKTLQGLQGFATTAQVELALDNPIHKGEAFMDADRVQQILTNLISNAIKFSPQESCVRVRAQATPERELELSVTDQGPGISEANQALIFEKFRQATDATNHLVKGTGLGLAISKALVEQHGGRIGVRSRPGQGATFYFTLKEWRAQPHRITSASPHKKAA